ncbi:MAG TPA: PAS domain S-box protein [Syntrophorhabdaceae bacterium]|nr:PAS domain S-box protein [Syntrophorhabdaceae bacterium]
MKDTSKTTEGMSAANGKTQGKRDNGGYAPEFRDLYHSFFEFAPEAMGVTDPETGLILDVNKAFEAWSGYTREELLGKSTVELGFWVHEEDRRAIIQRLCETEYVEGIELDWKNAKGDVKRLLFSARLIDTPRGKLVLSIGKDITERKNMERVLRESERRLSDIIEFLPDATFVIDREGIVIAWNRAMEEMSGVSKKDMIGKSDHVYAIPFYGRRRKLLIDMVGEVDENDDSKYIYVKRNGHTIYAEAFTEALYGGKGACLWGTAAALLDEHGNRVGAIESIRDITEHSMAEEKLRSSYEELRRLSAHIEEVRENERAAISRELHDVLGQILAVINMDLRWLNKKIPAHEKELLGKVAAALTLVKQATRTIQKVSSGLRPVVLDDFGLAAAVDHALKEFRDQTGITTSLIISGLVTDVGKDTSIALYRIFQEALTNVMRHSGATRVEVSLQVEGDDIQLMVRDNGRGISKQQISDWNSLGILGMRERVSFIGGRIDITGSSGAGTCITVDLPLKRTEAK